MSLLVVEEGRPFDVVGDDRRFLAEVLGRSLEWHRDGLVVWSLVGHLRLPSGTTLVIRSAKASLACVLAWAAWVEPSLKDLRHLRVLDDVGDDGDVTTALAHVFCDELLAALSAHGLRRRYRRVERDAATIRGPIDFARLARRGGVMTTIPCRAWERLPHTPLNRLLAAAVQRLHRDPLLRAAGGARLAELRALLVDVVPAIDPALLAGRRPLERDELSFAPACALARLVLRDHGIGTGRVDPGLGFLVALDDLFESAVVRAFVEGGLAGSAKYPAPYTRDNDLPVTTRAFELDFFIPAVNGADALVVDAKYKRAVDAGNLQQMTAYCHLLGAQRAALVYPAGHIKNRQRYWMHSPTAPSICIDILELDCSGRSVAAWRAAGTRLVEAVRQGSALPLTEGAANPVS